MNDLTEDGITAVDITQASDSPQRSSMDVDTATIGSGASSEEFEEELAFELSATYQAIMTRLNTIRVEVFPPATQGKSQPRLLLN